jgi:DUF971 family protein
MKQNLRPTRVEPTEDGKRLRIVWRDGHVSEYEPRALRLACPCAGCIDEYSGRPLLDPATVPADINPVAIDYVGRYALKFTWPDGHDTGMYPWDLLRGICPCAMCTRAHGGKGTSDGNDGNGEEDNV